MNASNMEIQSEVERPRNVVESPQKKLTIDIAASAVFGALSLVMTYWLVPTLPRVAGWQIAFFDPVSLVWITAFLIFGFRAGVLTTIIGCFGLLPFDPTGWVGPIMKFSATIWFILIPYGVETMRKKQPQDQKGLENTGLYFSSTAIAWGIRVVVMLLLNYFFLKYLWGVLDFVNLEWLGYSNITGLTAMFVTVIILNTIQSVGDAVIPYLIVQKTPLHDFKQW